MQFHTFGLSGLEKRVARGRLVSLRATLEHQSLATIIDFG